MKIRSIETHEEYAALEQIQKIIWDGGDDMVVPAHLLITMQKNGGMMLGAFELAADGEQLVGFAFGFLGWTKTGKLKHCSHMAGVLPGLQNRSLGYQIKMAQRDFVLNQGLDLITWTFDPLEGRNANLNFHKLGGVCHTYLRNAYGTMPDGLNAGLPSDRFQVDWLLREPHVVARANGRWQPRRAAKLLAQGVPVINPPAEGEGWERPSEKQRPWLTSQLLVRIPTSFQAIKQADLSLAHAWRSHTRELFETAFSTGYRVTDFLHETGTSYYLLETNP